MGRLASFGQNNKRGDWQKSPNLINGEVEINEEAGKNTLLKFWQKHLAKILLGLCLRKRLDQAQNALL